MNPVCGVRFHPADGHLYACGLFAWAGNRTEPGGFYRVRRTSRPLLIPIALHAEPGTISFTFASPLDPAAASQVDAWKVRTWGLKRTEKYGSQHIDEVERAVAAATLSSDGRQVTLSVPDFAPTWCYSVEWDLTAADGAPLRGALHGTMHQRTVSP